MQQPEDYLLAYAFLFNRLCVINAPCKAAQLGRYWLLINYLEPDLLFQPSIQKDPNTIKVQFQQQYAAHTSFSSIFAILALLKIPPIRFQWLRCRITDRTYNYVAAWSTPREQSARQQDASHDSKFSQKKKKNITLNPR